jgi:hypothetical protein
MLYTPTTDFDQAHDSSGVSHDTGERVNLRQRLTTWAPLRKTLTTVTISFTA